MPIIDRIGAYAIPTACFKNVNFYSPKFFIKKTTNTLIELMYCNLILLLLKLSMGNWNIKLMCLDKCDVVGFSALYMQA